MVIMDSFICVTCGITVSTMLKLKKHQRSHDIDTHKTVEVLTNTSAQEKKIESCICCILLVQESVTRMVSGAAVKWTWSD